MRTDTLKRFRVNRAMQWLGAFMLKITGWKIEHPMPPDLRKTVMIVAHHTSNWDFPVGLMMSFQMRMHAFWIGKHSLFKKPFGRMFRWLGGVPVNRTAAASVVDQMVEAFHRHDSLLLVITPEGTRKKVDRWKDGFYRIARAANVPISCAYIDFKNKVGGVGLVLTPTGDTKADMDKIRAFYSRVRGKYPDKEGRIYLPLEDHDAAAPQSA